MKLISPSPSISLVLIPFMVVLPLYAQSSLPAPAPSSSNFAGSGAQANAVDKLDLQIRMLESDGPEVKANSTPVKGFTVAVTNASGAPVADAAIAARLPDGGPTGTFADGSHSAVVYTDPAGRAHLPAIRWGQLPGPVVMRVTATKGSSHAALLFNETLTSDTATVVQVSAVSPAAQPAPPQPGQTAGSQPIAKTGATPLTPAAAATAPQEPSVSVTGGSPEASHHSSKTKWIILAVVAAAAGGAVAFIGKGKSQPASTTNNSLTIGTPSVSVGPQ